MFRYEISQPSETLCFCVFGGMVKLCWLQSGHTLQSQHSRSSPTQRRLLVGRCDCNVCSDCNEHKYTIPPKTQQYSVSESSDLGESPLGKRLALIQLKAQGPSRTCNKSKEEDDSKDAPMRLRKLVQHIKCILDTEPVCPEPPWLEQCPHRA